MRIARCSNGWREEGRGLGEERTNGEECRTDDKQHLLGVGTDEIGEDEIGESLCVLQICEHLHNVVINRCQYLH